MFSLEMKWVGNELQMLQNILHLNSGRKRRWKICNLKIFLPVFNNAINFKWQSKFQLLLDTEHKKGELKDPKLFLSLIYIV